MTKRFSVLLALVFPIHAFAWGALGHRAVGHIAESKLNPQAKAAVQRLLGRESMSDAATWADELRSQTTYKQSNWYHFEKISDGLTYIDNLKALPEWQKKKGGIVSAILVANEVLRDVNAPNGEKAIALKFLIHFVGDIHQPLHSGRPEDKGGVTIDTDWFGTPMSLHKIWDSGMIYTGHGSLFRVGMAPKEQALVYAQYLLGRINDSRVSFTPDIEVWLNESIAMRGPVYELTYQNNPAAYQTTHLPMVDSRIYTAGTRLADLLNRIFSGASTPREERDLRTKIEAIVGDIHGVVSFRP